MAKLKFVWGSMSSGKTLKLISTAYNLEENGIQIMVLKPSLDTRDGEGVIRTRAGLERKCVMIDKEDIDRLKEIFVTRQECDGSMEEVNKRLARDNTQLAVIETKLGQIMWLLGAIGTGVIATLIKLIFGV